MAERPSFERRLRERWRAFSRRRIPPLLYRYLIAQRNWRRGEPEIRLLPGLVPPGCTAIDVGAFLGAYTFFLRRLARQVHAFEPQPACAGFLCRAFPRGVTVHRCALSDYSGKAVLHASQEIDQAARIEPGTATGSEIEVRRLDDFDFTAVGFIKIDAEGCERRILDGASRTLERWRPALLVEIEQRHLAEPIQAVFEAILARGYRGSFLCRSERLPLERFSLEEHQLARLGGDRERPYINNFIFEPR